LFSSTTTILIAYLTSRVSVRMPTHTPYSSLGVLPIMVLSNRCRLRGKSANELQACKEEVNEFGGYFIVNGIERVITIENQ